jgi:hypothetical protein
MVERIRECRIDLSWMQSNHVGGANDRFDAPLAAAGLSWPLPISTKFHASF